MIWSQKLTTFHLRVQRQADSSYAKVKYTLADSFFEQLRALSREFRAIVSKLMALSSS